MFTLPQLAEITGIDYRTLHNWVRRGLLVPSHHRASGSGTTNLFNLADAFQAYILADLRQAGVEMRVLEESAGTLRKLASGLSESELIAIGDEIHVVASASEIDEQHPVSAPLFVYPARRAWDALRGFDSAPDAV